MTPVPLTELLVKQGDGAVIIATHAGVCRAATLNMTGFAVWELIDGKRTVEVVVSELSQIAAWARDVDPRVLAADVTAFVEDLQLQGFVELRR